MNAIGVFVTLLLMAGIAMCVHAIGEISAVRRSRELAVSSNLDFVPTPASLAAASGVIREGRAFRWFVGGALLMMLGVAVLAAGFGSAAGSVAGDIGPKAAPLPGPTYASAAGPILTRWIAAMVALAAIGGAIIGRGKGVGTKVLGVVTVASALSGTWHLIDQVKVGSLVKIDKFAPQVEFKAAGDRAGQEFRSELLITVAGFDPGEAALSTTMKASIDAGCKRLAAAKNGLVLVVGSTDRVRLNRNARLQFDSNVGLAQARAEQVKAELVGCHIQAERILTTVAGPRYTPQVAGKKNSAALAGKSEDRNVAVYALWGQQPAPAAK